MPGDDAHPAFLVDENVVRFDVSRLLTRFFELLRQVEQLEQQVLQLLLFERRLQINAVFDFALQ